MLTRLKVSGFKNLIDVDIRFGPFTCIAGANGVGKSNLFDAIKFLSALADRPLVEAALSVRDEGGRSGDVRSIFHRVGDQYAGRMSFEVEMIVPASGVDDLGQQAEATTTFLRYAITLAYREEDALRSAGTLEILREELVHIPKGEASHHLLFPHSATRWRKSAVIGARYAPYFISTEGEGTDRLIKLHQDGGSSGRPLRRSAVNLPRTVLSAANAAESPTALLARREMQSWRLLQLEPLALRKPDEFSAPNRLGIDGSHLPATLYNLARFNNPFKDDDTTIDEATSQVYGHVANRLSQLIDDVKKVWIDRDEKRELLTLYVTDRGGTSYPARALSDGTLRFLALAVLEIDPASQGVLCLEEPENGIHPARIPAMLELLQSIATNPREPSGLNNPLRQVIVNTHSPAVVGQVPDDSLVIAESREASHDGQRFKHVTFSPLPGTWREKAPEKVKPVPRGRLLDYLNPIMAYTADTNGHRSSRRVVDRPDLQLLLPLSEFPNDRSAIYIAV